MEEDHQIKSTLQVKQLSKFSLDNQQLADDLKTEQADRKEETSKLKLELKQSLQAS